MTDQTECPSCHQQRPVNRMIDGALVPDVVVDAIQAVHPKWSVERPVCTVCINKGKARYLQEMVEEEMGELTQPEAEVIDSIREDTLLSTNTETAFERQLTYGERWANRFADVVGSWYFSTAILTFLIVWVSINIWIRPFEPYPIIMLAIISAMLASIAAVQGPIILMAQRRQREWDRLRAENEYQINLKAELEIQYLDEKLNHILKLQKQQLADSLEGQLGTRPYKEG